MFIEFERDRDGKERVLINTEHVKTIKFKEKKLTVSFINGDVLTGNDVDEQEYLNLVKMLQD